MSDVHVREARLEDAALLARWAQAMAWETEHKQLDPDTVAAGVARGLAEPGRARYFVAERAGQPVGTLMFTTEWSDWRCGDWWWIQSVYVVPEQRRHGVFSALYRHVEALAGSAESVCGLRLYVERDNAVAQRTYERMGMDDAGYLMYEVASTPAR